MYVYKKKTRETGMWFLNLAYEYKGPTASKGTN